MFCLKKENEIIGCIDLEKNKIGGLFIKHNHIKKGYGKKLMKFIENYARKKQIKKLSLLSTKYALPFYKKLGYKKKEKVSFIYEGVKFKAQKMEKKV
jgi:N-acetylglutamate synthase-like GNAT family acetyltransferase